MRTASGARVLHCSAISGNFFAWAIIRRKTSTTFGLELPGEEGLANPPQAFAQGGMGGQFDMHLLGQHPDAAVDHRLEQALLAAELGIEGRQRATCPAHDFRHVCSVVAEFEEDFPRGLQEGGAAHFGAAGFRFGGLDVGRRVNLIATWRQDYSITARLDTRALRRYISTET